MTWLLVGSYLAIGFLTGKMTAHVLVVDETARYGKLDVDDKILIMVAGFLTMLIWPVALLGIWLYHSWFGGKS